MSTSIVKLGSQGKTFRRLDGIVTEKDGLVTVEYKVAGQVKTKTSSFPSNTVAAYQTGTPGFVVAPSTDPITSVVGKVVSSKEGRLVVSTEAGKVVINQVDGVSVAMDEVEADSVEARRAERASKVRVKLPRGSAKKASKSSSKAEKKSSSKSKDKGARTEVVKKKKKKA